MMVKKLKRNRMTQKQLHKKYGKQLGKANETWQKINRAKQKRRDYQKNREIGSYHQKNSSFCGYNGALL